ncbi:methylmalonyl-CoA epimerase [Candidatus Marinimicrobia bacterium]|jgi:methylmalonyl-CoA epimerase|nr:methylmalonyl-CoA epimerase [Candidatus Neomarinimicrobiota bacterium]MDA8752896.1 methylmalonyl-CoA epimerase [Candidatus Neomarinimicrobiota bacterium]MDC0383990.1 methylmalonyl-CoA epimerase [Candidatus Neomarinimicrobiota bacterium]
MKILGIEHVGIAVNNFEESSSFWRDIIGLDLKVREEVDSQGVITDIYPTGNGKIELLMETYPNSPISRFLKKRGPGIHHICLEVDDINKAMVELKEKNIKVIGDHITKGAEGYKIIFIHPSSASGVLVELAQKI